MKGIYPRIFEHREQGAEAKKLFADGQAMLERMIAEKPITARGSVRIFCGERCGR